MTTKVGIDFAIMDCMRVLRHGVFVILWVALCACPGLVSDPCLETRPTPEMACGNDGTYKEAGSDEQITASPALPELQGLGEELCNLLDDDADGLTDEGCPCSQNSQTCFAVVGDTCGQGEQLCEGASWSERCDLVAEPFVARQEPTIELEILSSETLTPNSDGIDVEVQVKVPCPQVAAPMVRLRLIGQTPLMWHNAQLYDNGVLPDSVDQDGFYQGTLPNIFGPGVQDQTFHIEATVVLEEIPKKISRPLNYVTSDAP
jgi:hypothetical protein